MELNVPELSLVLLMGASGSGKSTFAQKHFGPHEVVSSDTCRGIVSNDENNLAATKDAFELLHYIVAKRLKNGHLTVVDATNVQREARKSLVALARTYHVLPVAIILDLPQRICEDRNAQRPDRDFGTRVIRRQQQQLSRSLKGLKREGFRHIHILRSPEEVEAVTGIVREKLYNDKKHLAGPFDIIGDIHGCYAETLELLEKLGYDVQKVPDNGQNFGLAVRHAEGRQVVFLGDLVDRGPATPAVLKLVMSMVRSGIAWCVPGNHDVKLQRKLNGREVAIKYGLAETLAQLENESPAFIEDVKTFLYGLVSHYVFDGGNLVVAHAGLKEEMQGRGSRVVRNFCLYGETTGETDEFGLPIRYNWAAAYRGRAKVVYGHTPVPTPEWFNNTLNVDTGCVFGGQLTALRYPEETLVSVPAKEVYAEPIRPLRDASPALRTHQQEQDEILHIEDVIGKCIVSTRLRKNITIREENAAAALEVMGRFAINPQWLIYLPPTMSPCETSALPDFLEHPTEAFAYYRKRGVAQVICEEKHMGSRVIVVLCRDAATARKRFGVLGEAIGVCYTRTGRAFFADPNLEAQFLQRLADALTQAKFWETHQTDWVSLDAELMPWSAKAQSLLKDQYAAVGAAAHHALTAATQVLDQAVESGLEATQSVLTAYQAKQAAVAQYRVAYRPYCWPVTALTDYKLAPFHILATEGAVHADKPHTWHMEHLHALCQVDPALLRATPYQVVDLHDETQCATATNWWLDLTSSGGEGMVVKPCDFIAYDKEELLQPAIKCRGREYLRIIYGPAYDLPENLARLKHRSLSRKRSLALREFALGLEALERFVQQEPLRRVHEPVFGVLALESEPIDPRL